MLTISLNQIKSKNPCLRSWDKLLASQSILDPGHQFPVSECLDAVGIHDVFWLFLVGLFPDKLNILREFALACAERVEHLSNDKRIINCNRATRKYLDGEITSNESKSARDSARDVLREVGGADAARHAYQTVADDEEAPLSIRKEALSRVSGYIEEATASVYFNSTMSAVAASYAAFDTPSLDAYDTAAYAASCNAVAAAVFHAVCNADYAAGYYADVYAAAADAEISEQKKILRGLLDA